MALETALAFLRSADSRRTIPHAAVIFGPHAFLREAVLGAIAHRLSADGYQYRSFHIGGSGDYQAVIEEAGAPDLFAPKRIVVGRVLKSHRERAEDDGDGDESGGRAGSAGGETALAAIIERDPAPNCLVLIYERDNAPAKIRRVAEKSALLINCNRPFDNQIADYAEVFARARGLKLAPGAADFLAARYGGDLAAIANALGKAAIFSDPSKPIGPDDLGEPGSRRMPDVFEIADSLARGRTAAALAQIDRAIALGRDPIEILAVEIIPVMRRMTTAASLMARRRSPGEVAAALGMPPTSTMVTRAVEGARRFGYERLDRAYRRAAELDQGFKNGTIKEREQAIGALILELMSQGSESRRAG